MIPPRFALIVFLLAGTFLPARANLGETVEQLVVRYGKPTGYAEAGPASPFGSLLFRVRPYELVLFILDNKEVGARVSKVDKTDFSPAEMQTIIDAENGASPWQPAPSSDPSEIHWSRADHATFIYDKQKHMLLLTSDAMAKAVH
jgi:hypothetical protein